MKCSRHPDKEAVAQCTSCGKYICKTCSDVTAPFHHETGTICIDCCKSILGDLRSYYEKTISNNIKKIIVSIIFYAIGAVLLIMSLKVLLSEGFVMLMNPVILAMFVGGIVLCGFYTGISLKKTAEEDFKEYERKHGAQYTITENGIYREKGTGTKILYFFGGTVFGVVLTPIMLIVYAIAISVNKKKLKSLKEDLLDLDKI